MELQDAKKFVDVSYDAGRSREDTVVLTSALPVNGERTDLFEYIDLKYKTAPIVETLHFTDAENAEYFTAMYGDRLRYDHRRGRWLEWCKHYWRPDNDGQIIRLALKSMRIRYQNAASIEDTETRKDAAKKAIGSEQRARLEATLSLARNFKPIADSGEQWDKNPWLLAVKNGVIELMTGELRPGEQSDLITMTTPVEYQPDAEAPRWTQFLNEVFDNNTEITNWLQKYFGYTLTGITCEQIIPIGYGRGANGKTVLLAVTRYVIGEYAYDAPFSTFELTNRSAIPNDLAALDGKRFVTSSETTEGARFNEARIKALTGCDSITARFLRAEWFTFQPVGKFFLAVNSRPRVYDDSYGFWRRVRLIPFNRQFMGEGDDKELISKLITEAPGILAWMVKGCLVWQKEGMDPTPECIIAATQEYEAESDPLSEFILDECVISSQARTQSSRLYKEYKAWGHNQGMTEKEILTLNAFGRRMGQKFKKTHDRDGTYYVGLAMKCDGFVTEFKAMSTENELISHSTLSREDKCVNPPQSVNLSQNDDLPPYPEYPCPKCGGEWTLNDNCSKYICSGCGYENDK